jgi:predicted CxxxxCH...CXXCH cytochrome family protein
MGKDIEKKIQGMSRWTKTGLVLLLTLATSMFMSQGLYKPKQSEAAPGTLVAPAVATNSTGAPASVNMTIGAGTNRMLVVGVSVSTSAAVSQTCSVTYGGTALTAVPNAGTGATIAQAHTYLFYMPDNATLMNNTSRALAVTVTGGTIRSSSVWRAVYSGVNQSAPAGASMNSGATTVTSTAFTTGSLNIASGDIGFNIVNLLRTGSTTPRTITWAPNWAITGSVQSSSNSTDTTATNSYLGTSTTVNAADTANHTASGTCRISSSGMVIRAAATVSPASTISDCSGCHGYTTTFNDGSARNTPPGQFPGSHNRHVIANANACSVCHTTPATTVNTDFNHADGNINMAANINNTGGAYSKGATFLVSNAAFSGGTCSGTYCHGQGAPAWGASSTAPVNGYPYSASQCDKCHSGTSTAPFYSTAIPKVTVNTNAKVGAHTSHLTAPDGLATAFACADCHGTVLLNSATHMNGSTNFTWSALATKGGAITPTYTAATGACSNVYCHGASMPGGDVSGSNRAPVWNSSTYLPATITAAACGTCHGFPPPTTAGHPAVTIPAGFPTTASIGTTCSCHANINTAGNSYANIFVNKALHINGTVDVSGGHAVPFFAHATPPFTTCTGCHNASAAGTYPAATAGAAPNCRGCHVTADPTVTTTGCTSCHTAPPSGTVHPNILGSHTKHNALACATCHSGAGSGSGATHGPGNKGTNPAVDDIVFTAAQAGASATWTAATKTCANTYCHGATLAGGGTTKSPVWGTILTGCGTCHGDPPATSTHTGVTVTQCIGCHPHVNATGTGFTDATKHMNGVIDASGGVSSGGSPCYTCHSVFNVMNSSTASFHHVLDDATPDQAPSTGTYPSSLTVLACTSCHADHNFFNSNKGANLRTAYNGAAGATSNHDFSTAAPYGLCVSCHSTAQTKSTAQAAGGTTATIAIDGSATGFQASMHNYTASSRFGTSQFSANCVKCHTDEQAKDKQTSAAPDKFGPHFSAQRSLLNPMGATPQAAAGADFCYRCHSKSTDVNPGGGAAKTAALKDYFGSKAMTAASEDIFSTMQLANRHNVSSYKGLHKDDETRAGIAAVKHVECTDCHDPHLAKAGRHAAGSAALAGVLTGASGVNVTTWGANWAGVAATAYNPSTTSALFVAATAEWQVCFKCHSGANANVATWGGTAAAAFTDLALEFNPNNASGHPIVTGLNNYPNSLAPKALTAAQMKAPWNVSLGTQVMTCSDCHSTDSAASKGPHGSSVKWMLAGTNKAWPYTTTAGNGTSTGTLFRLATYNTGDGTANGLFCLNCHTIRPASGGNGWHTNSNTTAGQHGGNAIMACASCHIRVPHGGKISRLLQTTNAPARYKSNGSGATSNFTQFGPTTGTVKGSTASSSTFNSSCGEHSGTGGEAW